MKSIAATCIAALAFASPHAFAADSPGLALAKTSGCMVCHTADTKVVGPAYRDVAKKYAGDKSAQAKLAAKVKNGGSGVWGPVAMPPNGAVKDKDIDTLVKWILAGAK